MKTARENDQLILELNTDIITDYAISARRRRQVQVSPHPRRTSANERSLNPQSHLRVPVCIVKALASRARVALLPAVINSCGLCRGETNHHIFMQGHYTQQRECAVGTAVGKKEKNTYPAWLEVHSVHAGRDCDKGVGRCSRMELMLCEGCDRRQRRVSGMPIIEREMHGRDDASVMAL